MDWLVITESEEKAEALRKRLPNTTVIPTNGIPWDIKIEIQGSSIQYSTEPKETHKHLLHRIQNQSIEADRILLAFDPTTTGEATAKQFEKLLGKNRCARWNCHNFEERSLRSLISELETLPENELPKVATGTAESYWIQRTIDIIWAEKIRIWLSKKTSRNEKITRLMAAMLKTISDETRKRQLYQPKKYWEIRCLLKKPGENNTPQKQATATVPTLSQLGEETTPKTLEIWRKKLSEAKKLAMEGKAIPQPEPGQPWRYEFWEEAAAQKNHIEKFPYFIVQSHRKGAKKNPRRPPLTFNTITELAAATQKGTIEQTEKALQELHLAGWITQPKTTNPNLGKKAFQELLAYAAKTGIPIETELKNFGDPEEGNRCEEAIRPTRWERTPETANALLPESPNHSLKVWLYKMIHTRALESQLQMDEKPSTQCHLLGPLYIRKKTAAEKKGKPFHAKKEIRLGSHMNIILTAEWDETPPKEGEVLLCTQVEIRQKTMEEPPKLSEQELIKSMNAEGLGKRNTLKTQIAQLKKNGCLTQKDDIIQLTPKGASLCSLLNNHFGLFLDKNYHRSVAESLTAIEKNQTDGQTFLQEWWDCLKTYLEDEI